MLGLAYATAIYNGVQNYDHIREKLTDLSIYVQTLKSLAKASCIDYAEHEGIPIPNPVLTNLAKYHFATNFPKALRSYRTSREGSQ